MNDISPIVLIAGTRPEGIKIIPVYFALKKLNLPVLLCATSQHKELLAQVFNLFNVQPDIDFNIMQPDQNLSYITQHVLEHCTLLYKKIKPALILVQGDTVTAFAAALAAFYQHIPIGHIEAGLRTNSVCVPFPEEFNRRTISMIAQLHFTPTYLATAHLLSEGAKSIYQVGNTVVDALYMIRTALQTKKITPTTWLQVFIDDARSNKQVLLLFTVHRRETLENKHLQNILRAIHTIAQHHKNLCILFPAHPNPLLQAEIKKQSLDICNNIKIISPLSYSDLIFTLLHVDAVASDSGGISEEAISLGKKVFILRTHTERIEGVWAGFAELVGTGYSDLVEKLSSLKNLPHDYIHDKYIFGDGTAGESIARIIQQYITNK